MKKALVIVTILIIIGGGVYWYGTYAQWFSKHVPSNPPTKEELERIQAIEQQASRKAPNAKSGVGVVPKGSYPLTPPEPHGTSTQENNRTPATTTPPDEL